MALLIRVLSFRMYYGRLLLYLIIGMVFVLVDGSTSKKVKFRTIFLFTNEDDPVTDANMIEQCKQRSEDLAASDIYIELFSMNKDPTSPFNTALFYEKIIINEDIIMFKPCDSFDQLHQKVKTKEHTKRSLGTLILTIGETIKIGVHVYGKIMILTLVILPLGNVVDLPMYSWINLQIRNYNRHVIQYVRILVCN